jgi:CDP-diacylglycerol--serine O-phosphatidyltransferase
VPFIVLVVVVIVLAIVQTHPPTVLFILFLAYAISGPVLTLLQLRKHREQRTANERKIDES